MQDCWDTVECWSYVYLKQQLSGRWHSLSNYTPAATEAKHFFLFVKYLATGSREDGAQALKLQFAGTNSLSWGV